MGGTSDTTDVQPSPAVLRHFGLTIEEQLTPESHNGNWRARHAGEQVLLRCYTRSTGDLGYELEAARALRDAGWPVPVPLAPSVVVLDGLPWCVHSWLPGRSRIVTDDPIEQRRRGRLLAELHDATGLLDLGQREGWTETIDVVADARLDAGLSAYEAWFPAEAHLLRWHLDRTRARLDEIDGAGARRLVIHGDFAPWNLLYDGDRLTGVLDFETIHLDLLVAEFALAWRGEADALLRAYDEVRPLDDLDWALLAPTYWAWMFRGVADALSAMASGVAAPRLLRWPVAMLPRRTELMGADARPYRPSS